MKNAILTTLVAIATNASAMTSHPTKFSCSGLGGVDEYTVYVDLNKKLAGFFDNDNTTVIPQKDLLILESNPPQYVYTFLGQDTGSAQGDKLKIVFNETRRNAYVVFLPQNGKSKTLKTEQECIIDNDIDLSINE